MKRTTKIRIDREDELNLLERLTAGETTRRILLIQAASGLGKSELLREFMSRAQRQPSPVRVDFRNESLSLADILFHVCDTLGWERFQRLDAAAQKIITPVDVNITRNITLGRSEIALALGSPDKQTREMNRAVLTRALVDDLRKFEGATLVFDTFERCDPALKPWFTDVFLPHIDRSAGISVVIAGQQVPDKTLMWEHIYLQLDAIAPEHWHTYAQELSIDLSFDQIKLCCHNNKGHPLAIAGALNAFTPMGGSL